MFYHSEEDVNKSIDILKDLSKENLELKEEISHLKRFLVAACMKSDTGMISYISDGYYLEDIDELVKYVHVNTNYNNNQYINGELHPSECWVSFSNGDPAMIWAKRGKAELLDKFEQYRYKEDIR